MASAIDVGVWTTAAGLIIGAIGVVLAWRADRRLAALRRGFGEFVQTVAEQLTTEEVEAIAPTPLQEPAGIQDKHPSDDRPIRETGAISSRTVEAADEIAARPRRKRRAYVGAYDVTNEGQADFLIQSSRDGETRLSIVGIRNQEPVALSTVLRNDTGLNFRAEDIDNDGNVELYTVDRVDGAEGDESQLTLAVYRWNGSDFVRIDAPQAAGPSANEVEQFRGTPPWATQP